MSRIALFRFSILFSIGFGLLLVVFKINSWPGANIMAIIAVAFSFIYILTGIIDVLNSPNKTSTHKLLWILGFIFFNLITAIVYYLTGMGRKLE
jgi:hypothetical protein